MKFGLKKTNRGVKCVNCGKYVSKTMEFEDNYCSECGAPLKPESFDMYLERERKAQLKVVVTVEKELKNHTIRKIIDDLKEQLTEE